MSNLIKQLYNNIYDEEFEYGSFDKRLKMQKAVYLLETMGVNVGNYGFSWYKHGPYSQELQDDAFYNAGYDNVRLSEDAENKISKLKSYKSECTDSSYTDGYWMEDIASLYYMKYRMGVEQEELLSRLHQVKKHLNDDDMNRRALEIIDEIHSMVA